MFSAIKSNNLINKIQKIDNNQLTIYQRNLQTFMIEVYKILNGYVPPITKNMFVFRENVGNIRSFRISNKNLNTVKYDLETMCHRTSFCWGNLPIDIKLATSLSDFKTKIKSWN